VSTPRCEERERERARAREREKSRKSKRKGHKFLLDPLKYVVQQSWCSTSPSARISLQTLDHESLLQTLMVSMNGWFDLDGLCHGSPQHTCFLRIVNSHKTAVLLRANQRALQWNSSILNTPNRFEQLVSNSCGRNQVKAARPTSRNQVKAVVHGLLVRPMPRTKGMVRRVRGLQGERLAAPEDGWLRECILDIKCANPDFGIKRVLAALRDER